MKRCLPAVLLLLAVTACGGQESSTSGSASPAAGATAEGGAAAPAPSEAGVGSVQTFLLRGNDQDEFVPSTVNVKVGTLTLTLQNGDVPHNVVFRDESLPGIPTISGDEKRSTVLTFDKPGTYDFTCTIHPGMDGRIVVS